MTDSGQSRRCRRPWCCSFGTLPKSPENINPISSKTSNQIQKTNLISTNSSFPSSPQLISRTTLGRVSRIDPRRILSPGRVSPIDSDPPVDPPVVVDVVVPEEETLGLSSSSLIGGGDEEGGDMMLVNENKVFSLEQQQVKNDVCVSVYDVRLSVKGKNGGCLVLELDSEILSASSSVFANLILDCRKKGGGASGNLCRIEVPEVENVGIFHETMELMFEDDIMRRLRKMGVSRAIDVLEVAAVIMFTKGVLSCLKYIEAVPWSESEEDKLRSLFTRVTFDDATTRDVLARLSLPEQTNSQQHLALQLVHSVTTGTDSNSRSELKGLVKDLFAKSSVYEKDLAGLNKEDLYDICQSCLSSLVALFEEASASDSVPEERLTRSKIAKPLIERISKQADSINWLLEILLDQQMAEEFVDVWADQGALLRMHESVSPMVRYELSRISAWIFIALGKGKLQCRSDTRCRVLQAWFTPMLVDFGWLQRCRKGLDVKVLEQAMGQALLTLPMNNQQILFMEWFSCFSRQGTESPNLSKAFQIWWRRSSKSSGTLTLDSR
ncbi:BTB/POZ domain-containing protein [Thalictrum thalictroides]|uniref:BTB/POZ domain-containing protein n=1 Tax=Thalictrum thalictroides TaxID=46969 RepID=A0A7J6WIU3_THATH|nr:BTB/POZ domain-containing protein [Thalictrum thalictroides]